MSLNKKQLKDFLSKRINKSLIKLKNLIVINIIIIGLSKLEYIDKVIEMEENYNLYNYDMNISNKVQQIRRSKNQL